MAVVLLKGLLLCHFITVMPQHRIWSSYISPWDEIFFPEEVGFHGSCFEISAEYNRNSLNTKNSCIYFTAKIKHVILLFTYCMTALLPRTTPVSSFVNDATVIKVITGVMRQCIEGRWLIWWHGVRPSDSLVFTSMKTQHIS